MEKLRHTNRAFYFRLCNQLEGGELDGREVPHSCSDPTCPGDINRRKLEELKSLENRAAFIAYRVGLGAGEYESFTDMAAIEVVKAKLEAAEEMAKGLRWLRNENDRKKSPVELSNYAVRLINEMLTSWEKAGKGEGE